MPHIPEHFDLVIAGTRGVPGRHGGFETFAEKLSLHLVSKGWTVAVFCQTNGDRPEVITDVWRGVYRVNIPITQPGAVGTIVFDLRSTLIGRRIADKVLVLGYNTAIFSFLYRISGVYNVINMDGIEWKRKKWKWWQKLWLFINEKMALILGNILIADNGEISNHLIRWRFWGPEIVVIPYGADSTESASSSFLDDFKLKAYRYMLVICRPEPENQILEIVQSFVSLGRSDFRLVVLGNYEPDNNEYHRKVISSANDNVIFVGAIYDNDILASLRKYCYIYIHGHTVGGTNPSLVEAMASGCAILAADNKFNRWVAHDSVRYFCDNVSLRDNINILLNDNVTVELLRLKSQLRFKNNFGWDRILGMYEDLLCRK